MAISSHSLVLSWHCFRNKFSTFCIVQPYFATLLPKFFFCLSHKTFIGLLDKAVSINCNLRNYSVIFTTALNNMIMKRNINVSVLNERKLGNCILFKLIKSWRYFNLRFYCIMNFFYKSLKVRTSFSYSSNITQDKYMPMFLYNFILHPSLYSKEGCSIK